MNSKKWMTGAVAAGLLVATLTGCATNNKEAVEKRQDLGMRTTRVTDRTYRQINRPEYPNVARDRYDTLDDNMARGVRLADNVAHEVARMPQVDTASAIIMGRTAYLGVMLKKRVGDGQMSQDLNRQISARVRAVDPSIRRVYVSQNPDFVKQMNNYAQDLRQGRPVQGFFKNLMDIIRRTFPEAR
ncbi:YhcN/YlaJ family sporulation lipoprotein [Laceyella sediminis]|uniref:YhcN/YlaJ family sporulation lipoprotein n=1 Tax=Laceyella sediminis TaxID=573074 RepID=A0ABX5ESZ1_9BACL|nr:YhcN/YlaJ family sporulation lipoprotein [Laceyella sediminis]PRZ17091.1 YhcN/YlaJ family sporulation lipoprotein [Laceyella sediminis]